FGAGIADGNGLNENFAVDFDETRAAALFVNADELVRVAFENCDDLAGQPECTAFAADIFAAEAHADRIAIGTIHRRAGGDVGVAAFIATFAALWSDKAEAAGSAAEAADDDVFAVAGCGLAFGRRR